MSDVIDDIGKAGKSLWDDVRTGGSNDKIIEAVIDAAKEEEELAMPDPDSGIRQRSAERRLAKKYKRAGRTSTLLSDVGGNKLG